MPTQLEERKCVCSLYGTELRHYHMHTIILLFCCSFFVFLLLTLIPPPPLRNQHGLMTRRDVDVCMNATYKTVSSCYCTIVVSQH